MSLDPETRKATVLYRIEKAKGTWDDALFCIDKERWNMAANRMYYALFHAVSALLIANSIPANTHRGFLIQMNKYLVVEGTMTKEEARLVRFLSTSDMKRTTRTSSTQRKRRSWNICQKRKLSSTSSSASTSSHWQKTKTIIYE